MSVSKKKTAIGVGCVVFALAASFGAAPIYNHYANPSIFVVRANTKIAQNTKITSSMLEKVKVGAQNLPSGTIKDESSVVGKYAQTTISPHDDITEPKISAKSSELPEGQQLITIPIKSLAAGLNGNIQVGDIVSLYGVRSNGSQNGTSTQNLPDLQYVKVYATSVVTPDEKNNSTTNTNNMTLTLYATSQQASDLAGLDNSTVYVSLVSRGDDNKADELLQKQTDTNKTTPAATNSSSGQVNETNQ